MMRWPGNVMGTHKRPSLEVEVRKKMSRGLHRCVLAEWAALHLQTVPGESVSRRVLKRT